MTARRGLDAGPRERVGAEEAVVPERPAFRVFDTRVARVAHVTPSLVRVTLAAPELAGFHPLRYDRRIKLVFPTPGDGTDALCGSADWWGAWRALPTDARPPIRTYTVRYVRPEAGEIDVDLVVHGDAGVATRWARRAEPGDRLVVVGPDARAADALVGIEWRPGSAGSVLLAGDATALPAIANVLEDLPDSARGAVFVEVPRAGDRQVLPAPAGVEVVWLVAGDDPRDERGAPVHPLVARVVDWVTALPDARRVASGRVESFGAEDMPWDVPAGPAGDDGLYAWLAGERSIVVALRRALVTDLGVDRGRVAFMGYWREDRSSDA